MVDISDSIKIERVTSADGQYFFGYYDISPESPDGTKVLANKAPFIDHMPAITDRLEVGYFVAGKDEYYKIGETRAWNFQEGCRLQWLNNTEIIYNDRSEKGLCSIVYDIEKEAIVRKYDLPIYSISKSRNVATSYGFFNNKYSYAHSDIESKKDTFGDGVYLLDMETGKYKLIVPVSKLTLIAESQEFHNWVEYCTFSPDGEKFFIFHRWEDEHGLIGNQLCLSDNKGNVEILMNSKFISHTGWRGNNSLTAWARLPGGINSLQRNKLLEKTGIFRVAKRIYHAIVKNESLRQKFTNDAYIIFDLKKHTMTKMTQEDFTSDGHCTWSKDERYMLTDTYPDLQNKRSLMIYDMQKDIVYFLGKFYSFPEKKHGIANDWDSSTLRCDLHPKWSYQGNYIYFDSVHEGMRGLYRVNVSKLTISL